MKVVWILCQLIAFSCGSKLLFVFPNAAKSHVQTIAPIIKDLVDRGHNVTFLTCHSMNYRNETHFNEVHILDYLSESSISEFFQYVPKLPVLLQYIISSIVLTQKTQKAIANPKVQELFNTDQEFDAVLSTSSVFSNILGVFQHKFKGVGIEMTFHGNSAWGYYLLGNPISYNYVPDLKSSLPSVKTAYERIFNWMTGECSILMGYISNWYWEWTASTYFDYPGAERRPRLMDIAANKSLVLISSHPVTNGAQHLPPHFKEISGISVESGKDIPDDIKAFMDEAEDGLIFFSWGTVVIEKFMNMKANTLIEVFRSLKQRVLWKTSAKFNATIPPNVFISSWLPQSSILSDKKCLLFITHGGYTSIAEAYHYGVPMIGTPFFYDQFWNVNLLTEAGVGLRLDYDNITSSSLKWAIQEIIGNQKYTITMKEKSKAFKERPLPPVKEAVFWIEYVMRHGNVLRPALSTFHWYEKYYLDVLVLLIGTFYSIFKLTPLCLGSFEAVTKRHFNSK